MIVKADFSARDLQSYPSIGLRAISEMLRAHRDGIHLIVMERGLADEIAAIFSLNDEQRATLRQIRAEYTQTAGLIVRSSTYISVVNQDILPMSAAGGRVEVWVKFLVNSRILDRPILVLENLSSDGSLFEFLFNNIYRIADCPMPSWDRDHGGGDEIGSVVARRIEERRIVVALVDSDRVTPFEGGNDKIGRIVAKVKNYAWPLFYSIQLPCHEAENIIPFEVFKDIGEIDANAIADLDTITEKEREMACDPRDRFWIFFDIKNGFKIDILGKLTSDASKGWLLSKLALANLSEAEMFHLPGHGNKILHRALGDNAVCSKLAKVLHSKDWQSVFLSSLLPCLWVFAAARKQIT